MKEQILIMVKDRFGAYRVKDLKTLTVSTRTDGTPFVRVGNVRHGIVRPWPAPAPARVLLP